jgi:hypothetical protein
MAGVATVGGARKLQLPLDCSAGPFGACDPEGGGPTEVGDTGILGQGFPRLVCIPALH